MVSFFKGGGFYFSLDKVIQSEFRVHEWNMAYIVSDTVSFDKVLADISDFKGWFSNIEHFHIVELTFVK